MQIDQLSRSSSSSKWKQTSKHVSNYCFSKNCVINR